VVKPAGSSAYWAQWVGDRGVTIGIDTFGASAPAEVLFEAYGLDVAGVLERVKDLLD
jgi:transketolase